VGGAPAVPGCTRGNVKDWRFTINIVTISAIKADVGRFVGHSDVHPDLLKRARRLVGGEAATGLLIDGAVNSCGDDVHLVMTHRHGVDVEPVHDSAWDTFVEQSEVAKRLHAYGAGQDLLADAFCGNVRVTGPGVAELEILERPAEPFIVFAADKTSPGAWNLPLYKIFCAPFDAAGLIIVVGTGFQLADGHLVGPCDMLGDISFDHARQQALEMGPTDRTVRAWPAADGGHGVHDDAASRRAHARALGAGRAADGSNRLTA